MGEERPKTRFAEKEESVRIPGHAERPEPPQAAISRILRQAAPYMGAAWVLTGGLLAGLFGGRWLDGKLGTEPVFLVIGLTLGVFVGMAEVARVALKRGGPS